jgi:HEAT repeat protein
MTSKIDVQTLKDQRDTMGLLKALGESDPAARKAAAEAWIEIGDSQTVDQLSLLLDHSDRDTRYLAARALQIIGDKRALEPLIAALQPEKRIVAGAARALGALGDPRAVEPLIAALQQARDDWDREAVAAVLGDLRDPRAIDALVAAIAEEEFPWSKTSDSAAEALIKIGDHRAVEPLVAVLHRGGFAAAKAIEGISPPTDPLTQAWCAVGNKRWQEAARLGQVAIRPLVCALETQTLGSGHRSSAAEALGGIPEPESVPPLIAALQDKEWPVREAAAKALGRIGDRRAVEPLILVLRDSDEMVRRRVADALGALGDPAALEALTAALRDEDRLVRDCAANAIKAIRGRQA